MDITVTLLIMVSFFSILFGLLAPLLYFQLKMRRLRKQAIAKMQTQVPMFGPIKQGTTCDSMDIGRHDWKSVPIAKKETFDPQNPQAEDTLICMKCGVMSGSNNQFSPQGLEVLKKNLEAMEAHKAFAEEIETFRKGEIEKLFDSYLIQMGIPDEMGHARAMFDYGIEAVVRVDSQISQKVQQRQMDIMADAIKKAQNEGNANI